MSNGAKVIAAVCLSTLCSACSSSVYRVSDATGSVAGVPFYLMTAECRQVTSYQQDVRSMTLQIFAIDSGTQEAAPIERLVYAGSKSVSGATAESASKLRESVKTLAHAEEVSAVVTAFENLPPLVPRAWGKDPLLLLVGNVTTAHPYVDYWNPFYFNGSRPFIGNADITTELAPEDTLSKGIASIEDKTGEIALAQIPLSEYLSSILIPPKTTTDTGAGPGVRGVPQTRRALLAIDAVPVIHTLSRTDSLKGPCHQTEAIPPGTTAGVAYARTAPTAQGAKAEPPANSVGITGQITLPAPKK